MLRRSQKIAVVLAAVIAIAGAVAWFLYRPDDGDPLPIYAVTPTAKSDGYVGSTACRECHQEIHQGFFQHPMAVSLVPVNKAEAIEETGEAAKFQRGISSYAVVPDGEQKIHEERVLDLDGNELFKLTAPIQYTVGSGSRGRSYLSLQDGRLFQSPLTWYVEKHRWDLSPGYRVDDNQRFERAVEGECLSCHAGRMAAEGYGQFDRAAPFHEMSVGCERCHGPGEDHVKHHQDGSRVDSIINPDKLKQTEQSAVCNQCHLSGQARIQRFGRTFYDFRPGEPLEEAWVVFVAGDGFNAEGKALFTSHVEQMRHSQCFKGVEGKMTCYTCHDPHHYPKTDKLQYYRKKCLQCHGTEDCSAPIEQQAAPPANNSCHYCHMPRAESSDIEHTSLSDHRVLRNPSEINPSDKKSRVRWKVFDGGEKRVPQWELERATGIARYVQSNKVVDDPEFVAELREEAELLLEKSLKHAYNDPQVHMTLGLLQMASNRMPEAKQSFEAVVKFSPNDYSGWGMLGLASFQMRQFDEAAKSLRKSLDLNRWNSLQYGALAASLAQGNRQEEAAKALQEGLTINPMSLQLRTDLANIFRFLGQKEELAEQEALLEKLKAIMKK